MLKKICVLVQQKNNSINIEETVEIVYSYEETSPADTLIITDDIQRMNEAKNKDYAVLFIYSGTAYVKGAEYIAENFSDCDYEYLNIVFSRQRGIPLTVLTTKRTYLREITLDDLPELYKVYDDEQIQKYLEPLYDYEQEKQFTQNYIHNMYGLYGYGLWIIFDRKNNQMIGRAGISVRNIDGEEKNELGYLIRKEYRRQGYALEVCRGIMNYAYHKLKMEDLLIVTEKKNLPSCRLAEKLGFWSLSSSSINGCEYMIFQNKE